MKKINIKNYIYPLILLGVVIVLFITNYKVGTWLLGWDNLQSELNLNLNLSRNFYAGWQEYQGLGLASGHAHTVEFIRLITYFWLFLFTNISLTRYLFHFLMLFIGAVSTYRFCRDLFFENLDNKEKFSFIASLFYLLSLGTMQNFYVPLEAYSVFYAFFPMVTLYFIKFIQLGGKRNLFLYSISSFLILPAFHIQTYFIVLCIYLFLPFGIYILFRRNFIKNYLIAVFSLIMINSFWLGNVLFFLLSSVSVRLSSHINRFSSVDNFFKNVKFGNFYDVPLLRGFWFQNIDYFNVSKGSSHMLSSWIDWYGNNFVILISYSTFIIIIIGLFYLFQKNEKNKLFLLYIFLVSMFFLFNQNGLFGFVYQFFMNNVPLFAEVFRFPFTKFIVPSILIYSILFGFGINRLYKLFQKSIHINVFVLFIFIGLVYYALPLFRGGLINSTLKVNLPGYYLQAIDYFKGQDNNLRIATLPQESFWDWKFTGWGFRGGGFLWYGIEQPILDRAFDVWNSKNEQFYNEFQYALYSQDVVLLSSIFQKYDVGFLILDKSIIAPGAPNATFIPQTKKLLAGMPNVTLDKTFGDIEVYKINLPVKSNKWVVAPKEYINTKTSYEFSNIDSLSSFNLPYVLNNKPSSVDFPFADDNNLAVAVSKADLSLDTQNGVVVVPNLSADKPISANLWVEKDKLKIEYIYPTLVESGKVIYNPEFSEEKDLISNTGNLLVNGKVYAGARKSELLDKNTSAIVFDSKLSGFTDLSNDIYTAFAVDCGGGTGEFGKRINQSAKSIEIFLRNKNSCVVFNPDLAVKNESVVRVEFEYKATEGSRPLYCLSYNDASGCLNEKYENAPKAIGNNFVKYIDYVYVKDPASFKFLAILESDEKQKEQSAEFKNIAITSYKVLNKVSLAPSVKAYSIGKSIQVASNASVVLPDYFNLNKSYEAGDIAYNSGPKNCDNFNEISFDRQFSLGKYVYSAEDAVSCDSLDTANINTNSSYLIDFVYKNIEGKGLDVCFASGVLQKCMLQDRLLTVKNRVYDVGNSKTESFILPSYPSASKIQINIGNQSIGRVKTVNELYSVNTKYIPYEWLKGIYTHSLSSSQSAFRGDVEDQPFLTINNLEVLSVKKTQTYKYEVTTNGKDGLLVLNQSFDKGWVIYKKDSCLLGLTTPLTCFDLVKEHILVSNWANGWQVDGGGTAFIIVFWPQYMQFGGYLILIIWFVLLFFLFIKSKISNSRRKL